MKLNVLVLKPLLMLALSSRRFSTAFSPSVQRALSSSLVRSMSTESNTGSGMGAGTPTPEDVNVAANLASVQERIKVACEAAARSPNNVQLVAVSKTKPLELLQSCYDAGCRVFGENYAQELMQKSQDMPSDVHWHFIGTLQSNKANGLIKTVIPNSASLTIETVASLKLANKLNNAMSNFDDRTLEIFVQVNTSGEESKGGVNPEDVLALCQEITKSCDKLSLKGLMTIGAVGDVSCFDILVNCGDEVSKALDKPLALSMGMSGDFEQAIDKGATNVRVGSTIFGARDYSNK